MNQVKLKTVFFYGLFMDPEWLMAQGYQPQHVRTAYVADMGLRIGAKATIQAAAGEQVHGTVMVLPEHELASLYGSDGVQGYRPELVRVTAHGCKSVDAICYTLPMEQLTGHNSQYAAQLIQVANKLQLPEDYIQSISRWV